MTDEPIATAIAIRRLREERGLTQEQLAQEVGVSREAIVRREQNVRVKSLADREAFARALGVTLEQFDRECRRADLRVSKGGRGIPVINKAPAGEVIDYEEWGIDSGQAAEFIDWGDVLEDRAFAIQVVGDSMEPVLAEGDHVIFQQIDPYENYVPLLDADVVFVRFSPESGHEGCTIARWYVQSDELIRLHKQNPKYQPIMCQREDIMGLAKFVERRTRRV